MQTSNSHILLKNSKTLLLQPKDGPVQEQITQSLERDLDIIK